MTVAIQGRDLPAPLFHKIGEYTGLPYVARQACKAWKSAIDQDENQHWWGTLFNDYVKDSFFVLYTKRALTLGGCQEKTMRERVKEVFRLVVQDARALDAYKRCQEPLSLASFAALLNDDLQTKVVSSMQLIFVALKQGRAGEDLGAISTTQKTVAGLGAASQANLIHEWLNEHQKWLRKGDNEWRITHSGLRVLLPEIGFFPYITKLDLSGNHLRTLPREISKLTLKELNLSINDFKELPEVVLTLDRLASLDLHDNPIKELPEEITNLEELQQLNFRDTQITALPKGFEKLRELENVRCPEELESSFTLEKFPELVWLNANRVLPKEISHSERHEQLQLLPAAARAPEEKSCRQQLCEFFSRCFFCIVETITSCLSWFFGRKG